MEKGTLRCAYPTHIQRTFERISVAEELHHVETCFTETKGYPKCLLKRRFENQQQKLQKQNQ